MVDRESRYDPTATSPKGATGLLQLMPDTALDLRVNPADPEQNLRGGIRYIKDLIAQQGSVPLGLAAYNAGPTAVKKYGGIPPYPETRAYVSAITRQLGAEPWDRTTDVHGVVPRQPAGRYVPLPPQPQDAFVVDPETPPGAVQAVADVRAQRGRLTQDAGQEAQAHLRNKYDYLVKKRLIQTTEDFIVGAGEKSSMSGQPYKVQCTGQDATFSGAWLRERLVELRRTKQDAKP